MYEGYDPVDASTGSQQKGRDCDGHGTHCAGIAGGLKSGVAKDAYLTSIRVIDCDGKAYTSWIIDGMDEAYKLHLKFKQTYDSKLGHLIRNGSYRNGTLTLWHINFEILWNHCLSASLS